MRETRRKFVLALAAAASCCTAQEALLFAQRRRPFPDPPEPAERPNSADTETPVPGGQPSTKKLLQENEREFRAGVERLYELTGALRDEVQKTVSSDILSIRIYRKIEEIEKLARQLKNRAKR
jgi:hypothetical protein